MRTSVSTDLVGNGVGIQAEGIHSQNLKPRSETEYQGGSQAQGRVLTTGLTSILYTHRIQQELLLHSLTRMSMGEL